MTILVDMDDVLEDLSGAWIDFLNSEYGTEVDKNAPKEWDMGKSFPDLTKAQVYAPLYDPDFWRTVKPIDGAAKTLERLIHEGYEVFVVTASNYSTLQTKMEDVLFRYFPFLDWSNVIVASNKQMIRGDILVDDAPHNLLDGDYIKILMDAPHNRSFDAGMYGVYRAHSWAEIYRIIHMVSEHSRYVGVRGKFEQWGGEK